jgi:RNA polymerase sigma-70 factor (ECF subfamily)
VEPTDDELVRGAQAGDANAFAGLVQRYTAGLTRLASSMLSSDADADDVVQETFIGALRRMPNFEGRSSVKTWLTRILLNRVAKLYRSKRVRRSASIDAMLAEPGGGPGSGTERLSVPSSTGAVDSRVDVKQMLEALTPEHREVLVLRELEGLSYEEIAQTLGVPRGTVESRLHRARRQLKAKFEGYF